MHFTSQGQPIPKLTTFWTTMSYRKKNMSTSLVGMTSSFYLGQTSSWIKTLRCSNLITPAKWIWLSSATKTPFAISTSILALMVRTHLWDLKKGLKIRRIASRWWPTTQTILTSKMSRRHWTCSKNLRRKRLSSRRQNTRFKETICQRRKIRSFIGNVRR